MAVAGGVLLVCTKCDRTGADEPWMAYVRGP
jgi:hypothetical protein